MESATKVISGGEHGALLGTADLHGAVLQGLRQLIRNRSRKFRQLIEKGEVARCW